MWLALYQCFLTLPSVRDGNASYLSVTVFIFLWSQLLEHTFAISLQLLPASLICFSLCSSAGVQGVFVRPFFAGGGPGVSVTDETTAAADDSATGAAADGAGAIGLGVTGWPDNRRFLELTDVGVLCVCRLLNGS
jgi:hypothetical protein